MDYMKRALALARKALGTTSPNPAVGAVIVKDGRIIGEGFTLPPGQGHAEAVALEKAGSQARGAALYTTLEPCCIHGRVPPCTDAIINAGIREVHAAILDPNPKVNGGGRSKLEGAGIKVYLGEGEKEAKELCEAFAKHIKAGVPFVTAKFVVSLDGKIATRSGQSRWITSEAARTLVQRLRKASDAIMVGVNTVVKDDPRLTARRKGGVPLKRQPLRVVVDSRGRTPAGSQVFKEPGKTIIATTRLGLETTAVTRLEAAGAEVLQLPAKDGLVDLELLLKELGRRDVVSLLVEGGGTLLGSLFDCGLVDKVVVFIAPVIIGGKDAPSPVGGRGADLLSQAFKLKGLKVSRVGGDLLVKGYPMQRS